MAKFAYCFFAVICAFVLATLPAGAQSPGPPETPKIAITTAAPAAAVAAAGVPPANAVPSNNPTPATFDNAKRAGSASLMSSREFWLSAIILLFGIVIIVIEFFLLKDMVRDKTEEIARIYTVTLIIIGTLVLISSGFTNEQIAPALGLFGTIAGYLLGRSDFKAANREDRS